MRKHTTAFVVAALVMAASLLAMAMPGDASAAITKEQAEKVILATMPPGSKVIAVEKAKYLPGFWEVAVISRGKLNVVYLNDDGKTVVAGVVFDLTAQRNFTEERLQDLYSVDFAKLPIEKAVVLGNPAKAKYKAAVFDDPD